MKPSYEELEEQLNRSRRLCDAALANERSWETAMMQACGEDGPKSVADKFAELEARCAALAAENAGLNKFIVQSCYVFNGEQDEISDAYICATDGGMPQTPATDAFWLMYGRWRLTSFARRLSGTQKLQDWMMPIP